MRQWLLWTLIILAILGLADAAYLTAFHFNDVSVACSVGGYAIGDCNSVLTSEYATIGGIPISLIGVVYYFSVLALLSLLMYAYSRRTLLLLRALTGIGVLISAALLYIQFGVLEEICVYCLSSAAITTLLFSGTFVLKERGEPHTGSRDVLK